MSRPPNSEDFHALLKEIGDLHDKKQKDYGTEDDPFSNVTGSIEWGVAPWVGAMVRANDKMRRLQKVAQGGTLSNESARDSFLDLAVYDLIGLLLYEKEKSEDVSRARFIGNLSPTHRNLPSLSEGDFGVSWGRGGNGI